MGTCISRDKIQPVPPGSLLFDFKSIENPVWTFNSGENVENYSLGLPYIT